MHRFSVRVNGRSYNLEFEGSEVDPKEFEEYCLNRIGKEGSGELKGILVEMMKLCYENMVTKKRLESMIERIESRQN